MSAKGRATLAQQGDELFKSGASLDDMQAWARQNKLNPFGDDLVEAIAARDRGEAVAHIRDFEKVQEMQGKLQAEADAFQQNRPAPSAYDTPAPGGFRIVGRRAAGGAPLAE
jgi:hypothetical protein